MVSMTRCLTSSSTQGPTGKKGSGTLEYMPPHVNKTGTAQQDKEAKAEDAVEQ